MTNFTFEDTLTQIGLGYLPLFLIGMARPWVRWVALGVILVGYWGAFAAYPAAGPDYDYKAVGVATDWKHHATGLAAHWNKNANLASDFDRWFLNRFPREEFGRCSGVPTRTTSSSSAPTTGTSSTSGSSTPMVKPLRKRRRRSDPCTDRGVSTLKHQLPGLLPPHELTVAEKVRVFGEVTSILDQPLRHRAFTHNGGGYATLSFIPTLGTMLLGLIAGGWLRGQGGPGGKLGRMALAAVVCIAAGLALDRYGICPIVKRIWTPSWVLFSGGICFATLAALYAAIDLTGYAGWTYPLRVIGRNSIAAYVMAHLVDDFVLGSFRTHLGNDVFKTFGPTYEPLFAGVAVLATYWMILFWMDRRRIYLRV